MIRKNVSIFTLLLLLIVPACVPGAAAPPGPGETITVMAAASLNGAFEEVGGLFERQHPGSRVVFNFAGSQQLAQQIAQGAPADVFASANRAQMDAVVSLGKVEASAARIFASNRLVVIYPKENPAGITTLQDLAKPGLKIVLAAEEVPVGRYSLEFLEKASRDAAFGASFKDSVIKNVVSYEDNVKAVLTKVSLNEADAGIVYTTDAAAAPADSIGQVEIPDTYNLVAGYPIAVIKDSQNSELAGAFVDLVLSEAGQAVLSQYGFGPGSE